MLTTNIEIRKNKKFTTAVVGCFLRLPLTSHNLAFSSLLARLQMNTSLAYPTIATQQQKLAQLYDLQFDVLPQLFGKEIILTYYANFVEPAEILDPDYTYDEIIANRIEDKNAQIQAQQQQITALQLAASQAAQNNYLVEQLRPCPIPAYTVPNPFCCNTGYNGYGYTGC